MVFLLLPSKKTYRLWVTTFISNEPPDLFFTVDSVVQLFDAKSSRCEVRGIV